MCVCVCVCVCACVCVWCSISSCVCVCGGRSHHDRRIKTSRTRRSKRRLTRVRLLAKTWFYETLLRAHIACTTCKLTAYRKGAIQSASNAKLRKCLPQNSAQASASLIKFTVLGNVGSDFLGKLEAFREVVSFDIERTIPIEKTVLDKFAEMEKAHQLLLADE